MAKFITGSQFLESPLLGSVADGSPFDGSLRMSLTIDIFLRITVVVAKSAFHADNLLSSGSKTKPAARAKKAT